MQIITDNIKTVCNFSSNYLEGQVTKDDFWQRVIA